MKKGPYAYIILTFIDANNSWHFVGAGKCCLRNFYEKVCNLLSKLEIACKKFGTYWSRKSALCLICFGDFNWTSDNKPFGSFFCELRSLTPVYNAIVER